MPTRPDHTITVRIFESARALSTESPDWTMTALANHAGVSRSALYRRFSSRAEVLRALEDLQDAPAPTVPPSTHERALDALEFVAQQKGLPATTIEDVAVEAGLGVATIYRHFQTREGLLEAYAMERTPRATLTELSLDPTVPLRDGLHRLVLAAIQHLSQGPLLMMIFSSDPETEKLTGHLRELEAQGRAQLRELLSNHIDQGSLRGDPNVLTNGLVGLVIGSVLFADGEFDDIEELANELVTLFLNGCATAPTTPSVKP